MKNKIITLSILALIANSCVQTSNKQVTIASNKDICEQGNIIKSQETNEQIMIIEQMSFVDYLKAIPEIKFPLQFKCEVEPNVSNSNIDRTVIEKYAGEHLSIYGKITVNENYVAVIYLYPADVILPIIQTSDMQGNKISELIVYDRYCGADEFSHTISWAVITEDLTIILSDSTVMYDRNYKGEIIEETKTTQVRHRKFQIDNKGQISEKISHNK